MIVLGLEFALSKSGAAAKQGVTRMPSGRHDVRWVGCSDEPLMEQHRWLVS